MTPPPRQPGPRRPAVTLVEVTVSTALVALVLIASLETLGGAMRAGRYTSTAIDATSLAESVAAEATALPYEDPDGDSVGRGRETGEPSPNVDRLAFDDFDDFEQIAQTPPLLRDGTPAPGYDGWTLHTRVFYAEADPGGAVVGNISADEGVKRLRIQLTDPTGTVHNYYVIRSRYGVPEEPAPFDATRVTALRMSITVGDGDPVDTGVRIDNLAESP